MYIITPLINNIIYYLLQCGICGVGYLGNACNAVSVKGKAIPLQALTGPEGSRRLRLPDFKTIGT
jgi:hypothetical protein